MSMKWVNGVQVCMNPMHVDCRLLFFVNGYF